MKLTKVTYNKFVLKLYFDTNEVLPLSVKFRDNLMVYSEDTLPRKYWTVVRNITKTVDSHVFHKYLWELPKDEKGIEHFNRCMVECVKYINQVNNEGIRMNGMKVDNIFIDDIY